MVISVIFLDLRAQGVIYVGQIVVAYQVGDGNGNIS